MMAMPAQSAAPKLVQGAWKSGTNEYAFGHNSAESMPISGAPADANFRRWTMLHDGSDYRLVCFRGSSADTLYQFAFDGSASYKYGHNSIAELKLGGKPADADASSFAMLHDGSDYRLYLRKLGDPTTLYQFVHQSGTNTYQFAGGNGGELHVRGFPADTDWSRWQLLHDGSDYRLFVFKLGSNTEMYQGAFNLNTMSYEYGNNSMDVKLVNWPQHTSFASAGMLHDGADYRIYFLSK